VMLLVFFFLFWLHGRRRFTGQVILAYGLLYSVIRFLIEFVRADPRGDVFGLTSLTGLSTSQMISLPIALVSLIWLVLRWRSAESLKESDTVHVPTIARA